MGRVDEVVYAGDILMLVMLVLVGLVLLVLVLRRVAGGRSVVVCLQCCRVHRGLRRVTPACIRRGAVVIVCRFLKR